MVGGGGGGEVGWSTLLRYCIIFPGERSQCELIAGVDNFAVVRLSPPWQYGNIGNSEIS